MENEIMTNEVAENVEEIVKTGSAKGLKVAAGIGLVAIIGGLTYKFAVKPMYAKLKAKRNGKTKSEDDVIDVSNENEYED